MPAERRAPPPGRERHPACVPLPPAPGAQEAQCDGVDINLGCPQRIAKRGNYGAFLMDDLPRVEALVRSLAGGLAVPVTCKIRLFPDLAKTIAYARMLEAAGCRLLAVHGRTRDMKDTAKHRADWSAIAAVRAAVAIPVVANGDVRNLAEAAECMAATGATGVLSAEPLLLNPRLFDPAQPLDAGQRSAAEPAQVALEYLALCRAHPTPMRMIRGHLHKILQGWLAEFTDLRERISKTYLEGEAGVAALEAVCAEAERRIHASGRRHPVPTKSERVLLREAQEAARAAAMEEQQREAAALAALAGAGAGQPGAAADHRGADGEPAAKAARLEEAAPPGQQPATAAATAATAANGHAAGAAAVASASCA